MLSRCPRPRAGAALVFVCALLPSAAASPAEMQLQAGQAQSPATVTAPQAAAPAQPAALPASSSPDLPAASQTAPAMHIGHSPAAAASSVAPDAIVPSTGAKPVLEDFSGTLGADAIVLTWQNESGAVTGAWFRSSDAKDVAFGGQFPAGKEPDAIVLTESAGGAKITLARVPEAAAGRHGAQHERWAGAWTSADQARSLPIELTLRDTIPGATAANRYKVALVGDPAALERNAEIFRQALLAGNSAAAAARISFPLVVTIAGRRSLLHSKEAFAEHFQSLLTPDFLAALRNAPAHDMYATERGVCLGDGEVWFDAYGQAFAIDNAPVRIFAGKRFLSNHGYTGRHRNPS